MRDETPDIPTETPGPTQTAHENANLEEGENARRTVRRFLDRRKDYLSRISHVDENSRNVALTTDEDGENTSGLTAADLRTLLYWADRGLNSGWQALAKPGMPYHVDRSGLSEEELERIHYQQLLDVPIEDKCYVVFRGLPSVWYNHLETGSSFNNAMSEAEDRSLQDEADYTVMIVPRGSLQGMVARYVGVIKKSLKEALKEDVD